MKYDNISIKIKYSCVSYALLRKLGTNLPIYLVDMLYGGDLVKIISIFDPF